MNGDGEYTYNSGGIKIKLEKLSEVERSALEDLNTDVDNEVEVLPTPVKVQLIVSLEDDKEPPGPGYVHNHCPDIDKDNVVNQSQSEEMDVACGPSNNNKKQKLMIKNPRSSSGSSPTTSYDTTNNREASCSTLDLNDSPLLIVLQDGNSSLAVGSRSDDDDDSNGSSTLSDSADDENIDEFDRRSSMDILEPCTPVTTNSNSKDNSRYKVKVVDGKIVFDINSQEELNKKIELLVKLSDISSVKIIEIKSDPEDNFYIGYKQFKVLCSMSFPHLEKLHIGLNFHESITAQLFEDLLGKFGDNLVHFHVTGCYIGLKKEELLVRIPPLPKLEHFSFQSVYSFDTSKEVIEPVKVVQDGGVELIVLDDDDYDNEIPQKLGETRASNELFRITLFLPKLKCLKKIILGNYIKVITSDPLKSTVEEFSFEYFKHLEVFRVGSPWNDVIHFLPAKFYKVILKEIQFPDFLKDLTVISKIAEIFPKLESVHLNHPSPFILQQFIQIFSKLHIKELNLKTSFLFKDTDGRILCGLYVAKEGEEERKIAWFGAHGNIDGFEKLEENQRGRYKKKKMLGLGNLKKLKKFKFLHIPRKIYFPKFKETIGFNNYSKGFPGPDHVPFIQELRMLKGLKHFRCPAVRHELATYLMERYKTITQATDPDRGFYPKLLKVNKTDDDGGKKVKSEVKQENNTS